MFAARKLSHMHEWDRSGNTVQDLHGHTVSNLETDDHGLGSNGVRDLSDFHVKIQCLPARVSSMGKDSSRSLFSGKIKTPMLQMWQR